MSLSTDYLTTFNPSHHSEIEIDNIDLSHLSDDARAVLAFWFAKDSEPYWFIQNDDFDAQIKTRFSTLWQAAKQGECAPWRYSEHQADANSSMTNLAGRLAEIIVLDQFSRNLCRGQASAFMQDNMALILAQEAIHQPRFGKLPMQWRKFMILPMMHSESLVIHERYLYLFEQLNDSETLDFEHRHKDIIAEFGRYPHRNDALGRKTTAAERTFLQQPNSSF